MSPQQATTEAVGAEAIEVRTLSEIMSRTLPDIGMDRMTTEKIEELLAVPALTAHI